MPIYRIEQYELHTMVYKVEAADEAEAIFDRNDHRGRDFWVGTMEYGRVDCVGHLVQKFLKKFRLSDFWSLTYSASCSKQRVGVFGGGAVFVTADKIVWCNAHDFVEQQRRALEEGGIEQRLAQTQYEGRDTDCQPVGCESRIHIKTAVVAKCFGGRFRFVA